MYLYIMYPKCLIVKHSFICQHPLFRFSWKVMSTCFIAINIEAFYTVCTSSDTGTQVAECHTWCKKSINTWEIAVMHFHISNVQWCQFRINMAQCQSTYYHISLKFTLNPTSHTCTRPAAINIVALDTVGAGCGIRTKAAEGTTACKQKHLSS